MATEDNQLRPASQPELDNNGRNQVKPQTQEAYGDQPMYAESKVTFERHFAGQPLETLQDHDANEVVRAEQYARAAVDPVYAAQQKIDVADEDKDEAAYARAGEPLLIPLPDEDEYEDTVHPDDDLPDEDDLTDEQLEALTAPEDKPQDPKPESDDNQEVK